MPEITVFWANNNQTITMNRHESKKPMISVSKIFNLVIAILLIKFIQQFPPQAEGSIIRSINFVKDLELSQIRNRRDKSFKGMHLNSRQKQKNLQESDIKTTETHNELFDLELPNGIKLKAAGMYTLMIISGLCGIVYVCDRATQIILCICNRLNRAPTEDEIRRRQ